MQTLVNWSGIERSEALEAHINQQVEHGLRHYPGRFTRTEVHLHDDNADRGGPNDKRCVIEVRPTGADPLIIEETGDDFYATISVACKKLERIARQFVEKNRDH